MQVIEVNIVNIILAILIINVSFFYY